MLALERFLAAPLRAATEPQKSEATLAEKTYTEGQPVIYTDELGVDHHALITRWWGIMDPTSGTERGCNLLFVSGDERKNDECGRQMERATSVVHRSAQPAHGRFWRWPEEA